MTERDFSRRVTDELIRRGRRVLRVADHTEARYRMYGLRVVGMKIPSGGADYLVLPRTGMSVILARDIETVRVAATGELPFFLELKDPERRVSARHEHEDAQEEWMRFVKGECRVLG